MVELFTNSGDPDQAPQHAASDLDLHCSSITHLGISSPQWINDGVTRWIILLTEQNRTEVLVKI